MRKSLFPICLSIFLFVLSCREASANDIAILYTGSTHAMLYPCSCPKEPDGGVARRATLIKELRKKYPGALLLDAGGFFAGGLTDEYTQNTELDMRRSLVNLQAMELMGYDAAAVTGDEFNFGRDFLQKNIASSKIGFLSCDLQIQGIKPYFIKDIAGVKVGVTAVTSPAVLRKAADLRITEPGKAVGEAVLELKNSGSDIIILLSELGLEQDRNIVKIVPGIDAIISGAVPAKQEPPAKIGNTLYLVPNWQGRRLSKLTLSVENKKLVRTGTEEIRLSDKISDDSAVLEILPRCFSDANCHKEGQIGTCLEPGTKSASCSFTAANKVELLVITARDCRVCNYSVMTALLKRYFPGLKTSFLYYPDDKAKKMIQDLSIKGLPAYLLGKEAEKEAKFADLGNAFAREGDYYVIKPEFSGFSYLPDRPKISGRMDLFISLFDKNTPEVLEAAGDFNPQVHFLATAINSGFVAPAGNLEIEEDLRAVCVQSLYPEKFRQYIGCRSANPYTSWWQDCAAGMDQAVITSCAKGSAGKTLLKENVALNKEISIMLGPTYLLDNQEIFSTNGVPKREELKKLIKG